MIKMAEANSILEKKKMMLIAQMMLLILSVLSLMALIQHVKQ